MDSQQQIDEWCMRQAIIEAEQAAIEGEIPVGAIIVSGRRILARTHNLTERLTDVTAHAEIQAITAASLALGGKYLTDCTLYVTLEPCMMCAGALAWAQIGRIVYGASDSKRGVFSYFPDQGGKNPFHPKTRILAGVMADECAALMKNFFRSRR